MKKTIVLAICLLAITFITACGDSNENEELRKRIETLESRVSELEDLNSESGNSDDSIILATDSEEETVKRGSIAQETAETKISGEQTAESRTVAKEPTENNQKTEQSNQSAKVEADDTNNSSDLLQTARTATTEAELVAVARKCAKIDYHISFAQDEEEQVKIANALLVNAAATNSVMAELLESRFPEVWGIAALSPKSEETTLLAIAKKCAEYEDDKDKMVEIAIVLSGNQTTTNTVMAELVKSKFPEVWEIVVLSPKSGEGALLEVAKKCAKIDCYNTFAADKEEQIKIANLLSRNKLTTKAVMQELTNSDFPEVVNIGQQWIKGK